MAPHEHDPLIHHGGSHDETFGLAAPRKFSLLRSWDPRMKVIALGVFIACLACLDTLWGALAGLAGAVLLLMAAGVRPGDAARRLGEVFAFLIPFLILLPLIGSGEVLFKYGFLAVHAGGLSYAGLLLMKALAIVSVTIVLLESGALPDTFWALQALGVPRPLVQMALITQRYLPLLYDEKEALFTAAACRGYRMASGWRGFETTAYLAGAILVRGYGRAERVWNSMACRGFQGTLYPSRRWRIQPVDCLISAFIITISILLLVWDRWL